MEQDANTVPESSTMMVQMTRKKLSAIFALTQPTKPTM
jgi:hypothetical protein